MVKREVRGRRLDRRFCYVSRGSELSVEELVGSGGGNRRGNVAIRFWWGKLDVGGMRVGY